MGSLIFNFIKRAVVVPILVTAVVIAAIMFFVPDKVAQSNTTAAVSIAEINLNDYSVKDYKKLSELRSDDYVGSIECADIALPKKALVFDAESKNDISVIKGSVEPWNKGGMVIVGANTVNQFNSLHNVRKGDIFKVEFYGNKTYSYTVKKIVTGARQKELGSYLSEKTIAVAVPYNDFSDINGDSFYTVYIAKTK